MSITRKVLIMLLIAMWFVSLVAAFYFFFSGQYESTGVASLTSLCFFVIAWKGLLNAERILG